MYYRNFKGCVYNKSSVGRQLFQLQYVSMVVVAYSTGSSVVDGEMRSLLHHSESTYFARP